MSLRHALMVAIAAITSSTLSAQRIQPVLPPNNLPHVSPVRVEKFGVNPAAPLSLDWTKAGCAEIKSTVAGAATLLILGTQRIDIVLDATTRLFVNPELVLVLPGVTPTAALRVPLPVDRLVVSTPVYAQAIAVSSDAGRLHTTSSNGLKFELHELSFGGGKAGNAALPNPRMGATNSVPISLK